MLNLDGCYSPPSAMLPDVPMLTEGAVPAAGFLGMLLRASPSTAQLPTRIRQAQLVCPSATGSLQGFCDPGVSDTHFTQGASGLQAVPAGLVAGRDFAAFLITEDGTHQLDLTKASPTSKATVMPTFKVVGTAHSFF